MVPIENLILIIADALRYDFCMNSNIPEILSPSHKFLCFAEGSHTVATVPSILTGLPYEDIKKKELLSRSLQIGVQVTPLKIYSPTLFSILEKFGYRTNYINLDWNDSLLTGNQVSLFPTFPARGNLKDFLRQGIEKIGIVLHIFDVHSPYATGKTAKEIKILMMDLLRKKNLSEMRETYRNAIRHFEIEHLIPLMNLCEDLDIRKNTLIVLVGDHGELLGEHGRLFHAGPMTPELKRVPLVFHHQSFPNKLHEKPTRQRDILPTILKTLKIPVPAYSRRTYSLMIKAYGMILQLYARAKWRLLSKVSI